MNFNNLPLNLKITTLLMVLATASGASAYYASVKMDTIDHTYSDLIDGPGKGATYLARSRRALSGVVVAIYKNVLATSDADNAAARTAREKDEALFQKQFGLAKELMPEFKPALEEQEQRYKSAMAGICSEVIRVANSSTDMNTNSANAMTMNESCEPLLSDISAELGKLIDVSQKSVDEQSAAATASTDATQNTLLMSVLLATLATIGLALFVTKKFITVPFDNLKSTMADIGKGQLDVKVADTDRSDEVGAMAKTLEELRSQLVEAERLRQEQAREQAKREERNRMVAAAVQKFEVVIGKVVGSVAAASGQLEQAAESLTKTAGNTQQLSSTVASASEQTSTNVQGVAAASEELASTVSEIARQVQESADISNHAVTQAAKTNEQVAQLSEVANRIGDVVNLINSIAGQTNLLALNATIEAARAGDAGKGFAVVAQEVKALAAQTAKATNEIAGQITNMQGATQDAVGAIQEIAVTINKVNSISGAIAAAVEEQEATTKEITRNVAEAARGTTEVANNITEVSTGAVATGSASSQVLSSARQLAQESVVLSREVNEFLASIRAA